MLKASLWFTCSRVLSAFILALLLVTGSGCTNMEEVLGFRDRAEAFEAAMAAEADRLDTIRTATDPDSPALPAIESAVAQARAAQSAAAAAVGRLDAVLAEIENKENPLTGIAEVIAGATGQPIGTPLLLAAGLAASLWRSGKLKASAASIAAGLETAMQTDGAFKDQFTTHAATFRAIQTPTARKIVDKIQGKAPNKRST